MKTLDTNLAVKGIAVLLSALAPWSLQAGGDEQASGPSGLALVGQDTAGYLVLDGSASTLSAWTMLGVSTPSNGTAPTLLAIGAATSFDQAKRTLSIAGQTIAILPSTQLISPTGELEFPVDATLKNAAERQQQLAIAGDVVGLGEGIARFIVPVTNSLDTGLPSTYVRGLVGHVDTYGLSGSMGSLPMLLPDARVASSIATGDVVEVLGYLSPEGVLIVAEVANLTEPAPSYSHSGLRGISGSGLRGISGSGLRGISGSGLRGISGSGLRGISGSGLRGISGSGIKR